nr:MAG TPA: hypothetical protein [Caudoviricetes sp.]
MIFSKKDKRSLIYFLWKKLFYFNPTQEKPEDLEEIFVML